LLLANKSLQKANQKHLIEKTAIPPVASAETAMRVQIVQDAKANQK
jgi:hypothetical protein